MAETARKIANHSNIRKQTTAQIDPLDVQKKKFKRRERLAGVIDCSPFGCRTGFHLITWGRHSTTEVAQALKSSLEEIAYHTEWEDVQGTTIESCGNYRDHSLFSAKEWAKKILAEGISDQPFERHVVD